MQLLLLVIFIKKQQMTENVTEEDHEDDITEVEEEQYAKRYKHDPLLEFRNSVMGEWPGAKLKKSARDLKTEAFEEVRRYNC